MKIKLIFVYSLLILSPTISYANTKTPAKDITVDSSGFHNNLNSGDTDVQKTFNTVDNLSISSSPGGSNTDVQYNNMGILDGNSGFVYSNNNVGIGTNIPIRRLEVSASDSNTNLGTASLASIGLINTNNTTTNNFSDLAFQTLDSSGNIGIGAKIIGIYSSHSSGAISGNIAFLTKNSGITSEKMRITPNGNIGINTTIPISNLQVNGSISLGISVNNLANGNIGIGTNAPNNLLEARENNFFSKVYNFDGVSTYADDTTQAKITYGSPFGILFTSSQILYLGSTQPFSGISVALQQPTTATDTLIIKYWNGSSFATLPSFIDNTNNFQNDGTINFSAPSGWATTSVNSQTLYWISIQSTTSFSTEPFIYSLRPGTDSVLSDFCSVSDTVPCFFVGQNGNLLSPNISGTQTSVSTPATIVVGTVTSRQGRRVDYMCSGSKDQVTINQAISACPSSGCKIVLLEGTYNLTAGINWTKDNMELMGMGMGATILKPSLSEGPIIQDTTSSSGSLRQNPYVHDLQIDGTHQTGCVGPCINLKGISLPYAFHPIVEHTYVHNTGATGIATDFSQGGKIVNNVISNCGTVGNSTGNSGIGNGSSDTSTEPQIISGNVIQNSGYAGILLENQSIGSLSHYSIVSNNIILGSQTEGIVIRGQADVLISSNQIDNGTGDGVYVSDYALTPINIMINDNQIIGNSGYGIDLVSSDIKNVQVKNNDLTSNSSGTLFSAITDSAQLTRFGNTADIINTMSGNVGIGTFSNVNGALIVIGNVGVGSLSPSQVLDVTGTIRATRFTGDGSGLSNITSSAAAAGPTNAIQYNGGSSITAGSANFIYNGTNIGINSTTPGKSLDVIGTVRAIQFIGDGSALSNISASAGVSSITGDGLLIGNSSSTGAVTLTKASQTANTIIGSPSTTLSSLSIPSCSSGSSALTWTSGTGFGCNSISGGGSSGWTLGASNVGISTTNNVGIGTNLTTNAALTVMNGNVGIGTWNPNALIQISTGANGFQVNSSGNISAIGNSTSASISSAVLNLAANGAAVSIQNNNSSSGASLTLAGSSATNGFVEIRSTKGVGSGDFIKLTGGNNAGTEIARFLGTGNVGIGTTNPLQTLSINGVIGFKPNAPTISSCGTSPSGSALGNDAQGTITVGGTATGCTLAFIGTYSKSPHCNVTNQSMSITNALTYTESTSGFVVSQAVGLSGDLLDYHCTFDN